jgi:hypothetical protein
MKPETATVLAIAVADGIQRVTLDGAIECDEERSIVVKGALRDFAIYGTVVLATEWMATQDTLLAKILCKIPIGLLLVTTFVYLVVGIRMIRTKARLKREATSSF